MRTTKIDVEILWTLKQTSSSMPTLDIVKNNDRLAINDEFKKRLRFLVENNLIGANPVQGLGLCYFIKNKGEDLIESGNTRDNMLNLLQISDYTIDDLTRLINDSEQNIHSELKALRTHGVHLVDRIDRDDGKQYFRLSPAGENHLRQKNLEGNNAGTIVEHANQVNIANTINIQNFQNQIEELIIQIDQEPNLTEDQKKKLKEKIRNWKLTGREALEYGKTILPSLVTEGLRGLFGSG